MKLVYLMPLLALMLFAGCAQQGGSGVPKSANDKYAELSTKYSGGLGATLSNCTKGGDTIYLVMGSGGFSGETYHYDSTGKLLASYNWDDMVEPGEPEPPVRPEGYTCVTLKESKPQPS